MAIRPERVRQGETTPRHRMGKVLVISTVLAFVVLFLVAYIMGWRFQEEPLEGGLERNSSVTFQYVAPRA